MSTFDTKKLAACCLRLLKEFDIENGYPGISIRTEGFPHWGIVPDSTAELLFEMQSELSLMGYELENLDSLEDLN